MTTSRLPHVGRCGEVYFAHGYPGRGLFLSTLSGKLLAEAITGDASRLDLFSTLSHHATNGPQAVWPRVGPCLAPEAWTPIDLPAVSSANRSI
nr:hypothetical protein [Mesorhizobium sp.]